VLGPQISGRDESVQLFQIHGAFVAEPAKSLGEIIEFGLGKLWRSHATFLLPYGTVNLVDFETPRERPSEQVRHQRPGLALLSLRRGAILIDTALIWKERTPATTAIVQSLRGKILAAYRGPCGW